MFSRRINRFLVALVLLLLCGTACTSSPTGTGRITLGFSAWPGWFPWQVAQDQGFFRHNGIDVELKYFDSYTDSLNALSSGAIDANSQTLNDTLASVSGGAQQTVILVNDNSTGNDQVIAREGISGVGDLKGRKVAVEQGTVDHYLLLLALTEAGLSQKDVELVPLATDAAAAAFVAGKVDAVGAFAPFTTTALQRAGSRAIATSAEFPGAIPDHLVVSGAFAKNRPEAAQALVNTWFDTLDWIKQNHDQAVEIMARRGGVSAGDYRTYDAGTTIFTLRQNIDAFTPGVTPTHLNHQAGQIADFMTSTGLTPKRPSLDGLFDDKFVKAVQR
ncbi:ABC transporter substrate-binding protein [Lentzea sp. NPDC004789]